jgi:putative endonuclease
MKEHIYYTYIVASRSLNLYVGFTSDLIHRIKQHKEGAYEGYSKQYNCNRLVWFERYGDVHLAIAREKQLKGWTRTKKIALIQLQNPTWIDLSEDWGRPINLAITPKVSS